MAKDTNKEHKYTENIVSYITNHIAYSRKNSEKLSNTVGVTLVSFSPKMLTVIKQIYIK